MPCKLRTPITLHFLVGLVFALAGVSAPCQDPIVPQPASQNLGIQVQQSAQKVLQNCASWPPTMATNDKEQTRDPSKLPSRADVVISQLAGVLGLNQKITPLEYDGDYLRLLDSVGNFNPVTANKNLLGIAQGVDVPSIQLWGVSAATIKYDCLSMLQLTAASNPSFSIPLFSINAALKAQQSSSSNLTSTFIYGSFQSPFDALFPSADQAKAGYAATRALYWRQVAANPSNDQYVQSATVLSITKNYAASSDFTGNGDIKAGVSIPLVSSSVNGELIGQLERDVQSQSNSFITFFWNQTPGHLPSNSALVARMSNIMQQPLPMTQTQLVKGASMTATVNAPGWVPQVCAPGIWTFGASNPDFAPIGNASFSAQPASSSNSFPTCQISLTFTLNNASPASLDPGLYLSLNSEPATRLKLVTPTLNLVGNSSIAVGDVPANWNIFRDLSGQPQYAGWTISGHIDSKSPSTSITQLTFKSADFTCVKADGTIPGSNMTVQIHSQPGVLTVLNQSTFNLDAMLFLQGGVSYITDVTQSSQPCAIQGSVQVQSTTGGVQRNETLHFSTGLVAFPAVAPSLPGQPTSVGALPSVGTITLSWDRVPGATTYSILRSQSSGQETMLKTNVSGPPFIDSAISSGVTYFYQVEGVNAAGAGQKTSEFSVRAQ